MYKALVKEGWSQEAVRFIEKSKLTSTLLQEHSSYFLSELEILNYDEMQEGKEKQERFVGLVDKYLTGSLGKLSQTVYVQSNSLIKATVTFEHAKIQVNHYNKILINLESYLPAPFEMKLKEIKFKFNMDSLDFCESGPFTLSSESQIKIEHDLFISFDDFSDYIIL